VIYPTLAVLLLGQLAIGVGLLRLASRLREVRTTAMNALNAAAERDDEDVDHSLADLPPALMPGSTVPPHDGDERRWRVWVVLSSAHADLGDELGKRHREAFGAFLPQVLFVDHLPPGLNPGPDLDVRLAPVQADESQLPAVCMIDPDGTIQGAGRITTADEVVGFIDEGAHHGLGPEREDALTPG
jgi:hypothetical protein